MAANRSIPKRGRRRQYLRVLLHGTALQKREGHEQRPLLGVGAYWCGNGMVAPHLALDPAIFPLKPRIRR